MTKEVLVVYDSQTGFTERMAKAIVEGVESIKRVDAKLLKIGKPFSISTFDLADAIIIGSPTIYGGVTQEMKMLLESLKCLKEAKKLKLSGKIGGIFASYGWDGGWVADALSSEMELLGIKMVAPPVSIVHGVYEEVNIDEIGLQKCRDLGKAVAEKVIG